jgi:argininosuccinate lyase
MTFNTDAAARAAEDPFMVATDMAEELVSEGVPFRQAHEQVGRLVGEAVSSHRALSDVVAENPDFARFANLFEPGVALTRRRSPGSSGPAGAKVQHDHLVSNRARAGERLAEGSQGMPEDVVGPFL